MWATDLKKPAQPSPHRHSDFLLIDDTDLISQSLLLAKNSAETTFFVYKYSFTCKKTMSTREKRDKKIGQNLRKKLSCIDSGLQTAIKKL
jgi:hypothetical protein